ncbi:hypothetical protein PVK06_047037 [Gossypium arboreum]|uniref:Transposase MuDR plant domain-containing protein n=1 Tax=Gossypium arboreum TaxID=29729 RepID=A0ABR0MCP5_GOSAR|nr:hypothetical protein PVK06_047037 [Gossypium arboreum]
MHLGGSMFDAGNTYWGTTSTYSAWQSTSNWGRYETPRRKDDVLPMMSTGEGTSYVADDGGLDDESDVDPPREPGRDGTEVGFFSGSEPIPTEPEDAERGSNEEEDPRFRAYSPPAHMHNVDLSADDALEFPDLPYKTCDHTSSFLDSSEFEVGKEFSNKDSFLGALKQHSINNGVNYHVVKSKSDKFEVKCAVQDESCSWKIYASLRKRTGLWEIKKYKGPHTCAAGISQDHPKMDSAMLPNLILPTVKADPKTSVPILIANIRNQMGYTHRLLLAVAQDGSGRILPIAFAITPGESADDWDFFLSRLRMHVCPQPDIYVISD